MIQQAKREVADIEMLRRIALEHLQDRARAAAEDPELLTWLLGTADSPDNRQLLAKIFENLGR